MAIIASTNIVHRWENFTKKLLLLSRHPTIEVKWYCKCHLNNINLCPRRFWWDTNAKRRKDQCLKELQKKTFVHRGTLVLSISLGH